MDNALPCTNCKVAVPAEKAHVFAKVFVCPSCFHLATQTLERAQRELRRLMALSEEAVRTALVEGRLPHTQPPEDPKEQA